MSESLSFTFCPYNYQHLQKIAVFFPPYSHCMSIKHRCAGVSEQVSRAGPGSGVFTHTDSRAGQKHFSSLISLQVHVMLAVNELRAPSTGHYWTLTITNYFSELKY